MGLMREYQKPIVLSVWVGDEVKNGDVYKTLVRNHLVPYPTPDRAAKALARLVEYSEYRGVAAQQ